jgi:hypothetical protein
VRCAHSEVLVGPDEGLKRSSQPIGKLGEQLAEADDLDPVLD